MTTDEERSVPADLLAPLPFAAAFAHLRGAAAAVGRLGTGVDASDPLHDDLGEATEAIHIAYQALIRCVQRSRC